MPDDSSLSGPRMATGTTLPQRRSGTLPVPVERAVLPRANTCGAFGHARDGEPVMDRPARIADSGERLGYRLKVENGAREPGAPTRDRCETRRFLRLSAAPRRETFTGTSFIQRREVVGGGEPGGGAHRFSLRLVCRPSYRHAIRPSRMPRV